MLSPGTQGTVFRISPAGAFTRLHAFGDMDPVASGRGISPNTALVRGTDGYLYGTTSEGGAYGRGTYFRIRTNGTISRLFAFTSEDGVPDWHLLRGTDGSTYGTSRSTFFRIVGTSDAQVLARVGSRVGEAPEDLLLASDGNYYGITTAGGDYGAGTIYRRTPAGAISVIYSFVSSFFAGPLTEGSDGALYGTTERTIYRVTRWGAYTLLHTFDGPGLTFVNGPLLRAADGSFYGTTQGGGDFDAGVAFRILRTGQLRVLRSFGGSVGAPVSPNGGLIQGSDGNFYGTSSSRGTPRNYGTVYRLTPAGSITTVHEFAANTDGLNPLGLTRGPNGLLYGATSGGGTALPNGSLFSVSEGGQFTLLALFPDDFPGLRSSPLVFTNANTLYGTRGDTVYRYVLGGALSKVYEYPSNGELLDSPARLALGTDGNLYGTTPSGGLGLGTIFRLPPL